VADIIDTVCKVFACLQVIGNLLCCLKVHIILYLWIFSSALIDLFVSGTPGLTKHFC